MKYILRLAVVLLFLVPVAAVFANVARNVEAAVSRNVEAAVSRKVAAKVGSLHRGSNSMRMICTGNGCRACRVAGVLARAGRITVMQTTHAFALVVANRSEVRPAAVETAPPVGQ